MTLPRFLPEPRRPRRPRRRRPTEREWVRALEQATDPWERERWAYLEARAE